MKKNLVAKNELGIYADADGVVRADSLVVAQIFVAYLIELFGMFGVDKAAFEMKKLFGVIIAIIGIIMFS